MTFLRQIDPICRRSMVGICSVKSANKTPIWGVLLLVLQSLSSKNSQRDDKEILNHELLYRNVRQSWGYPRNVKFGKSLFFRLICHVKHTLMNPTLLIRIIGSLGLSNLGHTLYTNISFI